MTLQDWKMQDKQISSSKTEYANKKIYGLNSHTPFNETNTPKDNMTKYTFSTKS